MQRIVALSLHTVGFFSVLARQRWVRLAVAGVALWRLTAILRVLVTQAQWFEAVGYGAMWRRQTVWQVGPGAFCGLVMCAFAALSLRVAQRNSGPRLRLSRRYRGFAQWLQAFDHHAVQAAWVSIGLATLVVACQASWHWREVLLFCYGGEFGRTDPYFARDLGFFVFRLPGWHLLLDASWAACSVTLAITGIVALGRSAAQLLARRPHLPRPLAYWLALLWALWFALRAGGYELARFDLALGQHPAAAVPAGMAYVDWHVHCLLLRLGSLLCLATVGAIAVALAGAALIRPSALMRSSPRLVPRCAGARSAVLSGTITLLLPPLLESTIPPCVEHFVVAPDTLKRERPFVVAHLSTTRAAWQLDAIAMRDVTLTNPQGPLDVSFVRVWDAARLLAATRSQDQSGSPYKCSAMQLDRYSGHGRTELVGIGEREVAVTAEFDAGARGPVARIAPSEPGVLIASATATDAKGAPSWWRPATGPPYATNRIVEHVPQRSDCGYGRQAIAARAAALAPWLVPGDEPYAVITHDRLVWMLDLLTATNRYPGATSVELAGASGTPYNALRDSVKMLMEARDGKVTFYEASPRAATDPLLQAWRRCFPDVVLPYAALPPELRRHRRYPRRLFGAQVHLLARYGAMTADSFARQQPGWRVAADRVAAAEGTPDGNQPDRQFEYALWPELRRIRPVTHGAITTADAVSFALQVGLTNQQDEAALLRAGCDEADYGRLSLLRLAKYPKRTRLEPPDRGLFDAVRLELDPQVTPDCGGNCKLAAGEVLPVAYPAHDGGVRLLLFRCWYLWRSANAANSTSPLISGTPALWRVLVADPTLPVNTLGVGLTPQHALNDLERHAGSLWPALQNGPHAGVTAGDARIQDLTQQALRLHEQAQTAARRGQWSQFGQLWSRQKALLQQLDTLSRGTWPQP